MTKRIVAVPALFALLAAACASSPETRAEEQQVISQANATLRDMVARDPSLTDVLARSPGYVVFPQIGEGGFIVGGTSGLGVVYENGRPIGFARLNEGSIGLQAGGQTYSQLVIFNTRNALERLKSGQFSFTANATATAISRGAAASADFRQDTMVFVRPEGGLMAGVSVGGQRMSFDPMV